MTFLTAVISLLFLYFSSLEKVKIVKKEKRKSNIFLLAGSDLRVQRITVPQLRFSACSWSSTNGNLFL